MSSWSETLKKEFNTNTIANPLDKILPKMGIKRAKGDTNGIVRPSPIKAKAKNDFNIVKTDIKSLIFPIIIILIVFEMIGRK
jgi:hypothetical protein